MYRKEQTGGKMDEEILFSYLNDFIFCPASIYYHNFYTGLERSLFQTTDQINGTAAHESIESGSYSSRTSILKARMVFCERYNLIGKIDLFDSSTGMLTERMKKIKTVFDGYIFQLYAQYFALTEMGYEVMSLRLYSLDDNKVYPILKPSEDPQMFEKFEQTIEGIKKFKMDDFRQTNKEKCRRCIYEPACDRSLL